MENKVNSKHIVKGRITKIVTKKRLGWVSIGLFILAFGTAIATIGALIYMLLKGKMLVATN